MADQDYSGTRDRRRHVRALFAVEAMLEMGSCPAQSCQVFNMSVGGALVENVPGARLGIPVLLYLDDFGTLRGHVARVSSTVMAVAFENHDVPALAAYIDRRRHDAQQGGKDGQGLPDGTEVDATTDKLSAATRS